MHQQYTTTTPTGPLNSSCRKRRLSFTADHQPPMILRTPPWDHSTDVNNILATILTTTTPSSQCYNTSSNNSLEVYPDSPASCPDDDDADDCETTSTTTISVVEDDDSLEPASKIPRHVGTIYEERLAPLSPVTALPVRTITTAAAVSGHHRRPDSAAQARLLNLVAAGSEDALDAFLAAHGQSVDINQYDAEEGVTPLQRVCQAGGPVGVAQILVRHGADVRLTSRDGWSPLHMASFSGNHQLMMYLLRCPK